MLEAWDPTEIVVYGVALDVCDKYAIEYRKWVKRAAGRYRGAPLPQAKLRSA